MKTLVAVVGPTATGKSSLALDLAANLDGEIVNADSQQVYRFMNIGTAKPSDADRARVPHHLLDIVAPDEPFSVGLYQKLARKAIGDIFGRGKLPLLVGGSGLYVWSVLEGWEAPMVGPDPQMRAQLLERASREGPQALYAELRELDPAAAAAIDPHNIRRVVRALEVCRLAGVPFSTLRRRSPPPFDFIGIALTAPRDFLYQRIDQRVDRMAREGLPDEVRHLLEMGYGPELPAMRGIGYREMVSHLRGELSYDEALSQVKYGTHRLARRQYAWFHLDDGRLHWFDISETAPEAIIDWCRGAIATAA